MANSRVNRMTISGTEDAVRAFAVEASSLPDLPWAESLAIFAVQPDQGGNYHWLDIDFESFGAAPFAAVEEASSRNSGVVIAVASVELGNGHAEARVYAGGDMVGEYTMAPDEIDELAGPEYDEEAVFDGLFSTIAAYEQDALAQPAIPVA